MTACSRWVLCLIVMAIPLPSCGWCYSLSDMRLRRQKNPNVLWSSAKEAAEEMKHNDHNSSNIERQSHPTPLPLHHIALKTRNLDTAQKFYSLLGYEMTEQFRAGPARACWLEITHDDVVTSRLELLEVPSHILLETPGTRKQSFDLLQRPELLGYHHVALDVTSQINENLQEWLDDLNNKSLEAFGKNLRLAMEPRQQIIGRSVYELAFLFDPDGCLVELLHHQSTLDKPVSNGWEPWDGQGFQGSDDPSSDS